MATIKEMTPEELKSWAGFLRGLPEEMREGVAAKPPWLLYSHGPTGQRVLISSYFEDGTCRMIVSARYNLVMFEREVFGVPLLELSECDLPADGEPVGSMLETQEEVDEWIAENRERILAARPKAN